METILTEYRLGVEKLAEDRKKIEGELKHIEGTAQKGSEKIESSFQAVSQSADSMGNTFKRIKQAVVAFFAIDKLMDFGRAIISSTATVQKFAAVLTNTLGSSSAAQQAMSQLQEFASKTPFQLEEVTGSYIKLVNRGFKPTQEEMRRIGDLAASQGKSFEMLVEGILDAQQGEGERLKEFGIRMKQQGDNVSLSFKGITQNVENNEKAILDAILAYGDLNGVQGSMASVSKTLEGGLSNLSDNFFRLTSGIGNSSGILNLFVSALNMGVTALADWINPAQKQSELLEEQRTNLNMLVVEITNANISEEDRLGLITKLNQDYPDFLGNLKTEMVTNQQLAQRLSEVNNQLINKIILQKKQEEIEDIAEKAAEKKRNALTLEGVLMKKLSVLGKDNAEIQRIATSTDTIENKIFKVTQLLGGITNAEIALQNAVSATLKSGVDPFSRLSESNKTVLFLSTNLNKLTGIENEYNKIQNQTNDLISERVDLANKLGVSLSEVPPPPPPPETDKTAPKDAEKAAQLLIKLRNDTNIALAKSDKDAAILKIQQDKEKTEAEIKELQISGAKKAEVLQALTLFANAQIDKVEKDFEAKKKDDAKKDLDKTLKAKEENLKASTLAFTEQLANEVITQEEFNEKKQALEINHLKATIGLKKIAGEETTSEEQALLDIYIENNEKRIQSDKEVAEKRKADQQAIFDQSMQTLGAIADFKNSLLEREITLLQEEQIQKNADFDADIAKLQARKEAGLITEEELAKQSDIIKDAKLKKEKEVAIQIAEIKRKQAVADKAEALFTAAINTAVSVTKVLANPVLAVLVAIAGAAEIAAIAAKPLPAVPAFNKGTLRVTGGKPGEDSVLSLLTPGEAVVPADKAVRYNRHLDAMFRGNYEEFIIKTYLNKKEGFGEKLNSSMQFNDRRLIKAIRESKVVDLSDKSIRRLAGKMNGNNNSRQGRIYK